MNKCTITYTLEHVKYPNHKKPEYFIPDRDDCVDIRRRSCCEKFDTFVGFLGETFNVLSRGLSVPVVSVCTFAWSDGEYRPVFTSNDTISFCPFCGAEIVFVKDGERERIQT